MALHLSVKQSDYHYLDSRHLSLWECTKVNDEVFPTKDIKIDNPNRKYKKSDRHIYYANTDSVKVENLFIYQFFKGGAGVMKSVGRGYRGAATLHIYPDFSW